MKSKNPLSRKGAENTTKIQPLSPETGKKQNFVTLLRGKPNEIAHGSLFKFLQHVTSRLNLFCDTGCFLYFHVANY